MGADVRFDPYPRPQRKTKKPSKKLSRITMETSLDAGLCDDSFQETPSTSRAEQSTARNEGDARGRPEPVEYTSLAIRVIDRGSSAVEIEDDMPKPVECNEGAHAQVL